MKRHKSVYAVIPSILSFFLASLMTGDAAEPYENTILPSDRVPDFVKEQRENIIATGQFPLPKRDWQEVGLPPDLEEQVWNAWAPGAPSHWRNISPGYTNVIYDAKVDDNVITFVLDGFGLVQSKDGGTTWKPLSHHLTSPGASVGYYSFDISPADANIIAVAGVTIDRSLNGGRSWGPVIDPVFPPFKPMLVLPGKRAKAGGMAFGFVRFNADGSRIFASPGAFGHDFRERCGLETEMGSWLKRKFIYVGDGTVSNFKGIDLGDFAAIRFILPHYANPDLVYASFSDGSIYVCRNARAENPVFTELARPDSLNELQAIYMDVSPEDPSTLLLTLSDKSDKNAWEKSRIVLAKVSGDSLDCRELKVSPDGEILSFACAKWNPHNPKEVFVGIKWSKTSVLVSEDGMESFQ